MFIGIALFAFCFLLMALGFVGFVFTCSDAFTHDIRAFYICSVHRSCTERTVLVYGCAAVEKMCAFYGKISELGAVSSKVQSKQVEKQG